MTNPACAMFEFETTTLNVFIISKRLHGTGIFTYMYHKFQPNVGKYSIPMGHIIYIYLEPK